MRLNDIDRVNWILTLGLIPFLISVLWLFSYVEVWNVPLIPVFAIIFSIFFMLGIWAFNPRVRHWRKVYEEFDKNYRYEPEEGSI